MPQIWHLAECVELLISTYLKVENVKVFGEPCRFCDY